LRRRAVANPSLVQPASRDLAGRGYLRIERVAGQSAVTSTWASSPLKILVPRARGPSVWAYLGSFGGGWVAGDQTRLELELGEHARGFVSTQASTKLYRNPTGRACEHQLRATMAAGSRLVLIPDPIQAFAGSAYRQRQEFHLPADSGLVVVDWLASGRVARGERWALTRFESRTEVVVENERIFLDSLRLDPADGPLDSRYRLGRFNCLALVLVLGDPLRAAGADLLQEMSSRPVTTRATLVCSASPIPRGVVLRLAGEHLEEVTRVIRSRLAFVSTLLGDDPWSRKW
ncbi:MAG: urease accessory protein UreD, partial [Verrucomicrobia bacterium]|nr:urease accessory protein UreD [Verrucomicrobiota bacterium]